MANPGLLRKQRARVGMPAERLTNRFGFNSRSPDISLGGDPAGSNTNGKGAPGMHPALISRNRAGRRVGGRPRDETVRREIDRGSRAGINAPNSPVSAGNLFAGLTSVGEDISQDREGVSTFIVIAGIGALLFFLLGQKNVIPA